jgi:hypothetical protein
VAVWRFFPRAALSAELLRGYPWISPGHQENPMHKFFAKQAEAVIDVLQGNVRLSSARAKAVTN